MNFFVKFNLTDAFADSLINHGEIYTNCAKYYIYQKEYKNAEGIGDDEEGTLLGILRQNILLPLYCLYEVKQNDIMFRDGNYYIKIHKQMLNEFSKKNNDAFAVINSNCFISAIEEFKKLYNLRFDRITYTHLSLNQQLSLITNKKGERLTIKAPEYAYQQEVRLIIDDPFPPLHIDKNYNIVYFEDKKLKEYKGKKYYIGNMSGYAMKFHKSDLLNLDELYYGLELKRIKKIY